METQNPEVNFDIQRQCIDGQMLFEGFVKVMTEQNTTWSV